MMNYLYHINHLPPRNHSSPQRRMHSFICLPILTHFHYQTLHRAGVQPGTYILSLFQTILHTGYFGLTLLPRIFQPQIFVSFSLLYRNRSCSHLLLRKKPDRFFDLNSFRPILPVLHEVHCNVPSGTELTRLLCRPILNILNNT